MRTKDWLRVESRLLPADITPFPPHQASRRARFAEGDVPPHLQSLRSLQTGPLRTPLPLRSTGRPADRRSAPKGWSKCSSLTKGIGRLELTDATPVEKWCGNIYVVYNGEVKLITPLLLV